MLLKLIAFFCLLASSLAWLAPERCAQNKKQRRSVSFGVSRIHARSVSNIEEIVADQHNGLLERYKNHKFLGVPIRATTAEYDDYRLPEKIEVHAPYNCTFYTYAPRLISSVACINGLSCKLSRSVSLHDTYAASEGYNWGVKVASKASLPLVFEVGGEVSTGGTYSCSYTKGRTTTDKVDCSDSSGQSGHIQLYNVRSDMQCDFGEVKLKRDYRSDPTGSDDKKFFNKGLEGFFTTAEIQELKASAQVLLEFNKCFMIDTNKVSDYLFQKIMELIPPYNPYTDLICVGDDLDFIRVLYFKQTTADKRYRSVVPFTTEGGDSVFQYACTKG